MDNPVWTPAPPTPVDPSGSPAVGQYAGHVADVRWDALAGRWRPGRLARLLKGKRWHFVSLAGARCVVAFAIIDVGWATSVFAYVFERHGGGRGTLLVDRSLTALPGAAMVAERAGAGASSRFAHGGSLFLIERAAGATTWTVQARSRSLVIDATLDAAQAPPTLAAIAPIAGGVANCTHKTVGLPATGTASIDGRVFDLGGTFASLDHTSGLLARDTRWRWASASSARFGLNLVEDFNGPVENVVWLDGRMLPVGPVRFAYDARDPMRPWHITAEDGLLDLTFTPEGQRREDKDLVIAKSWYVQPIGTFSGVVRVPGEAPVELASLGEIVGVTEDHVARW